MSSIMLMFLGNGFWYAVEFSSPSNAFYELYSFFRLCYDNRDTLGYGVSIRILVAFFTPHFLFKLFLSTNWKPFLKQKAIKIIRAMRIKKKSDFNNSSHGKQIYSTYDVEDQINIIKEMLVQDIEEAIDKRLRDMLFDVDRDRSH
ncbi:MAG: hypothetical protein PV345_00740 [Wolbachia sp.]|nr:hypothetical protein [Wolbachia sp.]